MAARPWLSCGGRGGANQRVKGLWRGEESAIEGQKGESVVFPQDSLLAAVFATGV